MNYRIIVSIVGRTMCTEAVAMLPALVISLFCGESSAVLGFAIAILLLIVFGGVAIWQRPKYTGFYARESLIIVCFVWMIMSLFGALPFFISGAVPNFMDCIFETVSGFTTTGASVLKNVETLPTGLLYWRSFTQWLGGLNVLVFLLAFAPLTKGSANGHSMYLLRSECVDIDLGRMAPRMYRSVKILCGVYVTLTVLQVVLLLLGKMSLFDALTIAFGTASTGGFSVKNSSLMGYSIYVQVVTTIFMLLFTLNLHTYFLLLVRDYKKAVNGEELRVYGVIVIVSVVIIACSVMGVYDSVYEAFHFSSFHIISVISNTGFSVANISVWPTFSKMLLLLLLLIGGCAGSVGGGLKMTNLLILLKAVRRSLYEALHPNAVYLIHMNGEVVNDKTVHRIQSYTVISLLVTGAAMLLVSVEGQSFSTTFAAVISCLTNLGPGLVAVEPMLNFGIFSIFGKLILTFCMLLGHLEFYPMLILFVPAAWKKQ